MSLFIENLIKARSHLIFVLGIITAFGIIIYLDHAEWAGTLRNALDVEITADIEAAPQRPLTDDEKQYAAIAWKYFENNTIPETGMVNSVDKYEASTLWDTSSYLMGLISALRLELIEDSEFHERMGKILVSLEKLPLFDGDLPNKSYNTRSLAMVNYANQEIERGIGWSAIDIGRLLVPFNVLIWNYPQYTPQVRSVLNAWNIEPLLIDGTMFGATITDNDETLYVQEGRLGYEEYAAKSLGLMGLDVSAAMSYEHYLRFIDIYGVEVATDSRSAARYTAHNYVVSEPYILDGIEYGWDRLSREFAYRVYKVQELRYEETDILTAVSEDNIDQPPYFVYNTVYTNGKAWNAITEDGDDASEFRTLSTKAAIGWHMIFETEYTEKLMEAVSDLHDEDRGWYSGRYEVTGEPNKAITANTNGIILEALAYKATGVLLRPYTGK